MAVQRSFVIVFLLISLAAKFSRNFDYVNTNTNTDTDGYGPDDELVAMDEERGSDEFANFEDRRAVEPGYDEPIFPNVELLIERTTTTRRPSAPGCGRRRPGINEATADQNEDEMLEFDESPRIVGGQIAEIRRWPWQASLHAFGYHICGGSLIDSRHVVTAAHCFQESNDPGVYTVYLGKSQKDIGESREVKRNVTGIAIHPRYNRPLKHDSDIAVIRLAQPVQFLSTVVPICMPRRDNPPPPHGTRCYVTGYGETKGTGGTGLLKEAAIPIIETSRCKRLGSVYQKLVTENMICSGVLEGGVDSCQGDSGGPLVCETKPRSGTFVLQGIVSFGIGCGGRRSPGVYTRVASFVPWLRRATQVPGASETE